MLDRQNKFTFDRKRNSVEISIQQDHGSVRLNLPSFHELLHYESFVNISREGQGCRNTVLWLSPLHLN